MKPARAARIKTALAACALLALVGAFLAPELLDRRIVVERDALSSLLPTRAFLARSLARGHWPTWNPGAVLGKPFLAGWQPGLLYPPSLWLLVPPFSRGWNLLWSFHYLVTALGALVWTLGGAMVSLGHLANHLFAAAWLPWVLWAWERMRTERAGVAASAVTLALALLPGSPSMALLAAGALLLVARRPSALLPIALAAGLAAAQLVPTWLYLGETARAGGAAARALDYSASPGRLLELALPGREPPGSPLLPSVYDGPVPVALALLALATAPRRARLGLALVASLLAALALGAHTPILPALLRALPAAALLRYPEKLLVGLHALVAAGAAVGAERLLARLRPGLRPVLGAALLAAVALDLFATHRGRLETWPSTDLARPPAAAAAMLERRTPGAPPGAPVRYFADPTGGDPPGSPREAVLRDREILAVATGQLFGLADVNRPASLNLATHDRLIRGLGAIPRERALSALAALGTAWLTTWKRIEGSAFARPLALPGGGRARLYRIEGVQPRAFLARRIARARGPGEALERFLAAGAGEHAGLAVVEAAAPELEPSGGSGAVAWLSYETDALALEVRAPGRSLLVLSETFAPGWSAEVDGHRTAVLRVDGLMRGIALEPGRHRVELRYGPPGLTAGAWISGVTALGLALACFGLRARGSRPA